MVKTRIDKEANYKAIYCNGNTLRLKLDESKPMLPPKYPEFYDVAINNLCYANCRFCYVSATKNGKNFDNIVDKIVSVFEPMDENHRPFQVAIGGAGEPTLHPEFENVLKTFYDLEIVPNYTTNGVHVTDEILEATERYSEGVAISCHPHLKWQKSVSQYLTIDTRLNLHVIISDNESIDRFFDIYNEYKDYIEHFVLLPYMSVGRAKQKNVKVDLLFDRLQYLDQSKIAFGAHFYDSLINKNHNMNVSLYEPEMFSAYIVFDDPIKFYPSSYSNDEMEIPRHDKSSLRFIPNRYNKR